MADLVVIKKSAPRLVVGGDGELRFKATMRFSGSDTQSHMDSPFKYIEGANICPIGGIPNDLRVVDAQVDGVIPRASDGTIQIARTDTTSSGGFFIELIGHA